MGLPSNLELARVFESLQGEVKAEASRESTRIAEAWVSYGPVPWMRKALGLGIDVDVATATLDAIETFFEARQVPSRLELTSFADEALLVRLAERGYGLVQIGTVLARTLSDMTAEDEGPLTARRGEAAPPVVERVPVDDDAALREILTIVCEAFVPTGERLSSLDVEAALAAARLSGTETFVARVKGEAAGGASCTMRHGIAALYGAAVKPAHRRTGLHEALMIERMRVAADRGASVAVLVSSPGAATERTAVRLGFVPSYMRLALVRR